MKKTFCLLLCVLTVFCLFSCDEQSSPQNTQPLYPTSYAPSTSEPGSTVPSSTPDTSSPIGTTPSTAPNTDVTVPTTPPETNTTSSLPDEFSYSGEFKTDTGVYLNLRVKWFVNRTKGNDEVTVTANVYLDHYSLYMGKRTLTVTIADSVSSFDIAKFEVEENKKTSTLLATSTKTLSCKDLSELSFDIKASFKFNGTYAGKEIEYLSPAVTLKITEGGVTTTAH